MSEENSSVYEPLPSKTSIRVLLLAPGASDDEIFCWLLPVDLDADHNRFPSSSSRPIESISVVKGIASDGKEQKFIVSFDIYRDDSKSSPPMHPFQRYTALSYVWGDVSHPSYIILDGENKVPVTQNLHRALKALRPANQGICIWVDALCINQNDFEEKKTQIGLMRRIYQQAERVMAYVPQTEEDQDNMGELVHKIWTAKKKYDERMADIVSSKIQEESNNKQIGLIPVPDPNPITIDVSFKQQDDIDSLDYEAQLHGIQREVHVKSLFLEDFGLPPVNSPLWASWRRFFASPYFRRIWILQEFALANELNFCFGAGKIARMEFIMAAYHYIKEYSGVINAHYLGHSHKGDPEDLTRLAVAGALGAEMMFLEKVLAGEGLQRGLLIEKLHRGGSFEATDPRDKIYALLGLARDGEFFANHISYIPEETPAKVFTRFAKLFVTNGHIFEVLIQGGMKSYDAGLPSWVPNWASSFTITGMLSPNEKKFSEQINNVQILSDNKLLIRGALIDEIRHLGKPFVQRSMEDSELPPLGSKLVDFIGGLVNGLGLVLNVLDQDQHSFEEVMEIVFQVLIQKDASSNQTPAVLEEINSLRIGFGSCLGWFKAWAITAPTLEEGQTVIFNCDSPTESKMFNQFLQTAFQTTAHSMFCVTSHGRIGLVSDRTEVGDLVAVFHGCSRQFTVRKVSLEEKEENDETASYRLVGSGHLRRAAEGENLSEPEKDQDLLLI